MSGVARLCRGCGHELPAKHLRTQLAPPDTKWHEVRTHDVHCLIDFLQDEEDRIDELRATEVAWKTTSGSTHRPSRKPRGSGTVTSGRASSP